MKKLLFALAAVAVLVFGCSDYEVSVQQKQTKAKGAPFEFYIHEDDDGCKYLIVYEREKFHDGYAGGLGVGLGITPKVNQPTSCMQKQ